MIDFNSISDNLEFHQDGIWHAKTSEKISYPEEGNENCIQFEDESYWFNHRNNCVVELVKINSPDAIFFDVGGGNGFVSLGLHKAGVKTVLLEPGLKGAQNGKLRGLENVICATSESCGIKVESLDAIGVFDVVEHIKDDLKFLMKNCQMLKTGGMLYMTVPAFQFLWSNDDVYAGHYKRYNARTVASLLEKAGFKLEYLSYFFSILPLPVFVFRSLPSRFGFRKDVNDVTKQKKEHESKLSNFFLQKIWNFELSQIRKGKSIPFGSSIIAVAQKI